MDHVTAYRETRSRVAAVVGTLAPADEQRPVPACPDWDVHDLVAHMVGIPVALTTGNLPSGEFQGWLDGLVADRRDVPLDALLAQWQGCDGALDDLLGGGAGGPLLSDVCVHEHDLRGALDRPGARDSPELAYVLPIVLESFAPALAERALAPLALRDGDEQWQTHDGEPGVSFGVDRWEAVRLLESRRTAAEIAARPHEGSAEAYVAVIAAHLPLPEESLGE
jgi:uncharacterized protein (TIGR03083 family)